MCMRDHYEGTALDISNRKIAGGIWNMPYQPTPLKYELDGKTYFSERPISTQQTAFTFVAQLRSWLPREIGGVLWFGNDDSNMVAFTPIYCSNTRQPECYNTPGADAVTFSNKNAFWVCNWVSNMVYPRYSQMFPSLQAVRDSLDNSYIANQPEVEAKALEMLKTDGHDAVVKYLNDYSIEKAQQMLDCWNKLAIYLIVKYNDMTVKPEKNGKFERTDTGIGATVARPGYSKEYAREMKNISGDKYMEPTAKK